MVASSFCDDRQFAFRPLCNDNKNNNNNMNICLRFFHGEAMAQLGNRALLHDLRVADSSPAWQLLTFCHNVFSVLTKALCRHSSLVPRSRTEAFMGRPVLFPPISVTEKNRQQRLINPMSEKRSKLMNPGGHSITKHTGGLAQRSVSKTPKYLSKISILKKC